MAGRRSIGSWFVGLACGAVLACQRPAADPGSVIDQGEATALSKSPPAAQGPAAAVTAIDASTLVGPWHFELDSPGGPLPFGVEIDFAGGKLRGSLINGEERLALSRLTLDGRSLRLAADHYDSAIELILDATGRAGQGTWRRRAPKGDTRMQVRATRGARARFVGAGDAAQAPSAVAGEWTLTFSEADGSRFAGLAVLRAHGDAVWGTIMTDTGDYRYLAGQLVDGHLRLSVFDGAHAFLFDAKLDGAGGPSPTLRGDFWSRDSYHARFEGSLRASGAPTGLADPSQAVRLTSEDGRLHFDFPMLVEPGQPPARLADDDPRFTGKVVLVDIFGTWCPNCNDQSPILAAWHREYADRGLEIVGIAFEFSGDESRDMQMLARHRERYDLPYPLVLGGTSDKAVAGRELPDLSQVAAYPTLVMVGRDSKVARIFSGFAGPATRARHGELIAEHRAAIEALLAEPAPTEPTSG